MSEVGPLNQNKCSSSTKKAAKKNYPTGGVYREKTAARGSCLGNALEYGIQGCHTPCNQTKESFLNVDFS